MQYGSIENAYAHVEEIKPPRASANLKEHYELAQMSKTLATIDIHADISYELSGARLKEVSELYTQEAYLLCKKLEFKNLLSRFSVDAPKNSAEEYWRITDEKEARRLLESAKGRACGFYFVLPEDEIQRRRE